ncbi:MAG: hypothetical protein E6K72_08995 [Candidatus Eisenbacteria bacterium]|uniref:Uncharacterized protein n=1 Tax=Eiseniibacteriota bacterium TaxID=2212470 RepID=A0A538SMQ3_UNCEI|nr:MAG: hypothetical protein E6K72_08995 [Candidatus Eisenbacteria bacterium]
MTAEGAGRAPRDERPFAGERQAPNPTTREAESFARYMIGEPPAPAEVERYRRAVEIRDAAPRTERYRRLLECMIRRPWTIGPLDAGLALVDPESPVRFRLCLMLAVLEASPAHCRRFLPAPYPKAALLGLALRMAVAAARSVLGIAMVRTWGVLWR